MRHWLGVFWLVQGVVWAGAADYWVSPSGAAAWVNCRSASPLNGPAACSLTTANANAAAGDRVYLRGGTYSTSLAPAKSGTSANAILFKGYSDETPKITGTATAINASGKAYLTVEAITADGNKTFADLQNANHISILNCTLVNSTESTEWPDGIRMYGNSRYNKLKNSIVGHVGYSSLTDDKGGVMAVGNWEDPNDTSGFNLIENNTFFTADTISSTWRPHTTSSETTPSTMKTGCPPTDVSTGTGG